MGVFNWIKKAFGTGNKAFDRGNTVKKRAEAEVAWEALTGTAKAGTSKGWESLGSAETPFGHAGVAFRSADNPDLSAQNIAKWSALTAEESVGFLDFGEIIDIHSSWISMAQYDRDRQILYLVFNDFKDGYFSDVTYEEAKAFLHAPSKGIMVWSAFLVRGKGNKGKTRKPWTPGNPGITSDTIARKKEAEDSAWADAFMETHKKKPPKQWGAWG